VSDKLKNTEITGETLAFIEDLYRQYLRDPDSVDESWTPVFEEYFEGDEPPRNGKPPFERRSIFHGATNGAAPAGDGLFVDQLQQTEIKTPEKGADFAARVETMARAFRLHGHLAADIDPLGRERPEAPPELKPETYGFDESDLDTKVEYKPLFGDETKTLRGVISTLRTLYCGTIGVEYQDIPNSKERHWLRRQIERHNYTEIKGDEEREKILEKLIEAHSFEQFIHQKHVGAKRFAVTGSDSLIPMLDTLLHELGDHDTEEVVLGMAHRGRLNVLHNIMGKSAEAMLSEFEKSPNPKAHLDSSDVKYHMGYSTDFELRGDDEIHLSLCFNPSHLEYVDPVLLGRTRSKQKRYGLPESKERVVPLMLHGDASFAGQGIVSETLNMANLDGFSVGGTIHIVINNQIGFTTEPEEGRSTTYATDVAKSLEIPIFHVNGDDPEACCRVMKLAARYRQKFNEDVVVDLVSYRRYGHNEGDEPRYTQPMMYDQIDDHPSVKDIYADQLVDESVVGEDEVESFRQERIDRYSEAYKEIQDEPLEKDVSSGEGVWADYRGGDIDEEIDVDTTVETSRLKELGRQLATPPEDFKLHRTLGRLFRFRQEMADGERPLDWGMGEALAFATLLTEGYPVRMSGQDSVRGTFSHRHAAIHDSETGEEYWPHRNLSDDQGTFEIYNSMLSEAGVLGFEFGHSLDTPDGLTMWEAQFGDFANGAQVIIDQFINSSEDKWQRLSGLVMLLPHAYEGQGPEHSSARLERYLQMCAEDNMFVCNLTTPGQYFHVLRRQMLSPFRKPLIIMTPKSLLRHKDAVSELEQLSDGGFNRVIPEVRDDVDDARKVLICSGKVYYDLVQHARDNDIDDVAIIRLEQIYPLDGEALKDAVSQFSGASELAWVQEEPKNMGAWPFMYPRLRELFEGDFEPQYIGRVSSASPATGSPASHEYEQDKLIGEAFE
jgi:2-oxoglutarate dehydrogenase E1 component